MKRIPFRLLLPIPRTNLRVSPPGATPSTPRLSTQSDPRQVLWRRLIHSRDRTLQQPFSEPRRTGCFQMRFWTYISCGCTESLSTSWTRRRRGSAISSIKYRHFWPWPFQQWRQGSIAETHCMRALLTRLRYTSSGQEQPFRTGLEAALQARCLIDVDNPTVEGLQTLLLLSQAFYAYGLGKKAYMTFCKHYSRFDVIQLTMNSKLCCHDCRPRLVP